MGRKSRLSTADSSIEIADVGAIRVAKVANFQRRVAFELKPHDPVRRYFSFVLQLSGSGVCSQQRRSARLDAGKWAAFETGRIKISSAGANSSQLVLLIPQKSLPEEAAIRQVGFRALPGSTGASRVLFDTAVSLVRELPRISVERAEAFSATLCSLVSEAIHERLGSEVAAPSIRTGLRERIRHYIDAHLRDPSLSLDRVAAEFNCTKRYLHKVCEGEDASLSTYILQERLQRSYADLSKPELTDQSITAIALSWGFNSMSHFSRSFRRQFGVTPREVRLDQQHAATPGSFRAFSDEGVRGH